MLIEKLVPHNAMPTKTAEREIPLERIRHVEKIPRVEEILRVEIELKIRDAVVPHLPSEEDLVVEVVVANRIVNADGVPIPAEGVQALEAGAGTAVIEGAGGGTAVIEETTVIAVAVIGEEIVVIEGEEIVVTEGEAAVTVTAVVEKIAATGAMVVVIDVVEAPSTSPPRLTTWAILMACPSTTILMAYPSNSQRRATLIVLPAIWPSCWQLLQRQNLQTHSRRRRMRRRKIRRNLLPVNGATLSRRFFLV